MNYSPDGILEQQSTFTDWPIHERSKFHCEGSTKNKGSTSLVKTHWICYLVKKCFNKKNIFFSQNYFLLKIFDQKNIWSKIFNFLCSYVHQMSRLREGFKKKPDKLGFLAEVPGNCLKSMKWPDNRTQVRRGDRGQTRFSQKPKFVEFFLSLP